MMDVLYASCAAVFLLLGLLGSIVPVLPGPVLSYAALLVLLPSSFAPSAETCVVFGVGCAVVLLLDTVVPALGAKKFKCSKWGVIGSIAGSVIGMFFGLAGLVLGPFLGAVSGEMMSGRTISESMKGGVGAFVGFVFGVLLKAVYGAVCAGWCIYGIYCALSK